MKITFSANDIVNEYTKVPIIAEQNPWKILKEKTIIINKVIFDIKYNKPYRIVIVASKKVAKHNKCIRENFLQRIGTIAVNIAPAMGNIPIIQPSIPSLKWSFLPKVGSKGDTKEYPVALKKLIIKNNVVFSNIFLNLAELYKN